MIYWLSCTRGKDAPKEISMTANSSGKKGYQSQHLFLRSQVLKHLTHSKGIWQAPISCYSVVVKHCLVDAKNNFLQMWWHTGAECFFYGSGFAMSVAFSAWRGQLDYRRHSNQIFSTRTCWMPGCCRFLMELKTAWSSQENLLSISLTSSISKTVNLKRESKNNKMLHKVD